MLQGYVGVPLEYDISIGCISKLDTASSWGSASKGEQNQLIERENSYGVESY